MCNETHDSFFVVLSASILFGKGKSPVNTNSDLFSSAKARHLDVLVHVAPIFERKGGLNFHLLCGKMTFGE